MYSLDTLTIRRWHLFKEAEFQFREGITVVGGENASGKSLLFGAIPTMLSLIHDKDEWEAPPKNSKLHLTYRNDETPIEYAVVTNASSKFHIGVGNVDMEPHKKADAKNLLLKNWKIPKALFNSTIFLRGIDRHALSQGTPGTRSTWLSEALDLTAIYDAYKAYVDDKIKELGIVAAKQEVLIEEREKVQSRIPDSNISQKQAKRASRLLKRHRRLMNKLPARKQTLENTIRLIDQIEDLPDLDKSASYYQKKLDKHREDIRKLEEIEERQEEYEQAKRRNAKIREEMAELEAIGVHELTEKKYNKLVAKVEESERLVKDYIEAKEAYEDQSEEREALADLSSREILSHSLEESENLLSALVYRASNTEELLESLRTLGTKAKNCPTCGNKLTKEHVKQEIRKLEKDVADLPKEVKDAKAEVRYWKLKKIKFVKKPNKPDFTSKQLATWRDQIEGYDRYNELKAKLVPEAKVKVKNIGSALATERKQVKKYERYVRAVSSLEAYSKMLPDELQGLDRDSLIAAKVAMEDELATIKEKIQNSSDVVRKYSEIEVQYDTQKKLIAQYRSTVNRLTAEIEEMQQELKDLPAWKANALAFGNSGVRLFQLKESAAVLSAKLTELSSLFFNTTYHFNIEVAPHKLNVMVERNGRVGSVKTLSGAETRSWNLLCAMALMRILPSNMRCDTIFLDEVEANMAKSARERYVRDVLPELATIVPKIVVITPLINGEMPIQADYDFRVVKERVSGEYISRLIAN